MTSYPAFHLPKAPKKSLEINFVDHYDITHNHEQVRELLLLLTNSRKKTIEFMSQFPAPNADALSLVTEYLPLISGLNEAPLPGAEKKEDAPKEGEAEKAPEEAEKGKEKAEVKEEEKKEDKKEEKKEDKKEEKKEDDKKGKKGKEEEKKGPIALQRAIAYSWSDFSRKERPLSAGGVDFEISSIIFSLGVWNLQISKQLCEDTDESKAESNQKEAFRFCAKAAGVFQYVADKATEEKGDLSDLRPNVSKALVQFSLAEGQAITIERAMKSKHNHNLISALSTDVAKKFQDARDLLVSPNPTPNPDVDESLLAYLDYKIQLYLGLARFYQGEHFAQLEAGSAGKAVKCMEVGLEHLKNAKTQRDKLLTLYPEAKSKLKHIKEYLEVLTESVQERFNKTKKENDMVYFEKLPENADELPEGKCTIEPVAFEFPETDKKRWTPEVYGSLVAKVDALEELKKSKSSGGCCILM